MPRAWPFTLAFLVVSVSFAGLADAAAVTPQATKLDVPIVGAAAAQVDGVVYLFGGRETSDTYSSAIRRYDPATGQITTVAHFPAPVGGSTVGGSAGRYSGTAVAFGGKIYFFGGTQIVQIDINADGNPEPVPRAVRDIFEFNPANNQIRLLNDRLPIGTWGMAGAATSQAIYLFGGFTFDYSDLPNTGRHDWVLRFVPTENEGSGARLRELSTKLPYGVQDGAAAVLGRRVYIMGGLSDHNAEHNPCPTYTTSDGQTHQIQVCITKRIIMFDPTFGAEFAVGVAGEIPYRAQFIHAGVAGGKAYIPGGLLSDGSAASTVIEVAVSSAGTPSARVITPSLPGPMFGQAVTSDGTTLLVLGGRSGAARELSDAILRLDPRPTPPWAPRSAVASDIQGGVRLTWEAPAYNGDSAVTGYRIYRAPVGGAEARLTETTVLSYDDTTVRPGTEYVWRITAVNAIGESEVGARVTRAGGLTAPGAVGEFVAYPGNNEVVLRWIAPEETGGSNITGYRVIRDGRVIASPPPGATEYVDRDVTNGETYRYQIRAVNAARGEGAASPTQTVTPVAVPPPPSAVTAEVVASGSASSVRVSWIPPASPVQKYIVYRSTLPGRAGEPIADLSDSATTYVDTAVSRGRTYYYAVVSENAVGQSPPSAQGQVALVRKPEPPSEVSAVGLDGEVRISWAAPIDTGDAPVENLRYYVSRQGGGSSSARIIATDIETMNYIDRAVTPNQTYTYTVTTLNPMQSDPSAAVTATPKVLQNRPPVAVLSILPPIANANDPIELDASQSSDIDGSIRTYYFDFGDGTDPVTTQNPTVSHQYARNGTYLAKVTVTDNRNAESVATAQVIIGETVTREVDTGLPGR
ncbi:MAG TPA: fibronectin type III domain-containing protein, partial [Candidatus Thermoplasmatota archaeon]|nr:fibronectin type III domain-containing protein [Candidatus Thermoplasmatota archaeon]